MDADLRTGVAHLEDGHTGPAATALGHWLSSGAAQADSDRATTAAVLLVFADSGPVEAVRCAVHRSGTRWLDHCPLNVDDLFAVVAADDPELLVPMLAGLPEAARPGPDACAAAGRALLDLALRAEHAGTAAARLASVEWLLGGE